MKYSGNVSWDDLRVKVNGSSMKSLGNYYCVVCTRRIKF